MKPLRSARWASNLAPLSAWNAQSVTACANYDCQYPTPQNYLGSRAQLILNILMVGDIRSRKMRAHNMTRSSMLVAVAPHLPIPRVSSIFNSIAPDEAHHNSRDMASGLVARKVAALAHERARIGGLEFAANPSEARPLSGAAGF
jgi:hypothetical protein